MAFRCSKCNGSMVFDIASQQMKCKHCGSTCAPEAFSVRDTASSIATETHGIESECPHCSASLSEQERAGIFCPYCGGILPTESAVQTTAEEAEELSVFLCQNCGAELEATEDSLIGLCPYCGGQSLVKNEGRGGSKVERIIPFKITRERCSELYQDYAGKVLYLPKDFRNSEHLQNFIGIYMPYYKYDVVFQDTTLSGTKTEEKTSYDLVHTFSIPVEIEGDYLKGAPFDGSKYLDDELSRYLMPFDTTMEVEYHPAYLSGFYADATTVSPDLYTSDARTQAEKDVVGWIDGKVSEEHGIHLSSASKLGGTVTDHHSVLFPMWFLTWRKESRVAYAVINGVSGKIVSDLPLDMGAFWLGCGKLVLLLFLLLELFFQPTPQLTSMISLGAALCMGAGIMLGTKTVYEKQMHINDKGWKNGASSDIPIKKKPSKKKKTPKQEKPLSDKSITVIANIIVWGSVVILIALMFLDDAGWNVTGWIMAVLTLLFTIFAAKKVYFWQNYIKQKDGGIAIVILLLTVLVNAAVMIFSPASDLWYYAGDAICIVGLVVSSFGMLRIYNVGTTRPLPKLFDRKEM